MQKFAEGEKGGIPPFKQGENIDLRIAHWCLWGPRVSGMYETVRELIAAEMKIPGVLPGICETPDPNASESEVRRAMEGGRVDGLHPESRTQDWGWAMKFADIHIIHSTVYQKVKELKPKVFFQHGTPEACLENDLTEKTESFISSMEWIDRYDASFVTSKRAYQIWKEFDHEDNKVHLISKGIDLDWWQRAATKQDLDGKPSVLYGDIWRPTKHPLHLFYAINEIYKRNPEVRFNPWGCNMKKDVWDSIVKKAWFDVFLGKKGIRGIVEYPEHFYTRGDVLVSPAPFGDVSRVMQEAMACGCPVVAWDSDPFADLHVWKVAKPFSIEDLAAKIEETSQEVFDDREGVAKRCRELAERHYDINNEAKQIVEILRNIVSFQ